MQIVTRRTGLSPAVLRIWERRYGVVRPTRSPKGRRLYSDQDIERLRLLARATHGGRTIGQVASLTVDELETLVRRDAAEERTRSSEDVGPPARRIVEDAMSAVERLESAGLEGVLRRAMLALPAAEFLEEVIQPLLHDAGERWRGGAQRPVHGQLAAAVIRRVIDRYLDGPVPLGAPEILVGTPAGQRHELGGLMVAATAATEGFAATYLGAELPAEDLTEAVRVTGARVLALSIVHPSGDRGLAHDLRALGAGLPRATLLLVGGAAAASYGATIAEIGGERFDDLASLRARLRGMR